MGKAILFDPAGPNCRFLHSFSELTAQPMEETANSLEIGDASTTKPGQSNDRSDIGSRTSDVSYHRSCWNYRGIERWFTKVEYQRQIVLLWDVDQNPVSTRSKTLSTPLARAELERFLTALFHPDELIEIRLIDEETRSRRNGSPLVQRRWLSPGELLDSTSTLTRTNREGAHVFFGVNPRFQASGTKDSVSESRVIWADLDNVSLADVASRWRTLLPEPSIIVDSGHGAHLYWLLDAAVDLSTLEKRDVFEATLRGIYQALGADATQDVSRLLRLPGFMNVKSPPAPCRW